MSVTRRFFSAGKPAFISSNWREHQVPAVGSSLRCGVVLLLGALGVGCSDTSDNNTPNVSVTDDPVALELQPVEQSSQLKTALTHQYLTLPELSSGRCSHCLDEPIVFDSVESSDDGVLESQDSTTSPVAAEGVLDSASDSIVENTIDDSALSSADNNSADSDNDFTETNVQVSGVDEADVWKFNGDTFFVLSQRAPQQVRILNNALTSLATIDWSDQGSHIGASDIFLTDQQLVTLNQGASYFGQWDAVFVGMPATEPAIFIDEMAVDPVADSSDIFIAESGGASDISQTESDLLPPVDTDMVGDEVLNPVDYNWGQIQFWNIEEPTSPVYQGRVAIEGYIKTSRRIDNDIWLVSEFYPRFSDIYYYPQAQNEVTHNQAVLNALGDDAWLPRIMVNGEISRLIEPEQCWTVDIPQNDLSHHHISVITRLDIETLTYESRCVAGAIDGIYMTTDDLYLYSNSRYVYDIEPVAEIESDWSKGNTHLHHFTFDQDSIDYRGSALVGGHVGYDDVNFRMGQLADGSFVVVTNDGDSWWGGDPDNRLTVLQSAIDANGDRLVIAAQIPNADNPQEIGKPGERIYSVRVMQNRAYIVTFQNFDPLYVIDLADPTQPRIAGELEIPGFSDYLHPVGDHLLVGVGQEVANSIDGVAYAQGVKVALYDVSNMTQPQELESLEIGRRGSSTPLSFDHHAFSGFMRNDDYRFTLPISVHDDISSFDTCCDPESQYYDWSHTGLYGFSIDHVNSDQADTTPTLRMHGALITHLNESQRWDDWNIRRGIMQGDSVYHLVGDEIYQADWNNLNEVIGPK